jgi:hypothetical protein
MTVVQFGARVASAFFLWPKELLETELNRNALVSTVQHDLFDGNPDGWKALPTEDGGALVQPTHDAADEASLVEATRSGERGTRKEEGLALGQAKVDVLTRCRSWHLLRPRVSEGAISRNVQYLLSCSASCRRIVSDTGLVLKLTPYPTSFFSALLSEGLPPARQVRLHVSQNAEPQSRLPCSRGRRVVPPAQSGIASGRCVHA